MYNDLGDFVLGYIAVKIVNEYKRENVIETIFLNGYRHRQVAYFPFQSQFIALTQWNKFVNRLYM